MNPWTLPVRAELAGRFYGHKSDFRDMLKLMRLLNDERRPAMLRWYTAVAYFYEQDIPDSLLGQAMDYLARFLSCGSQGKPGPRLFDWEQDAGAIIADVNRAAGRELRAEDYVHWWTFLGWFQAVGQGQLSLLVGIRDKLRRGQKLEPHERAYYLEHKDAVVLKTREDPAAQAEKQRLLARLGP